MEKEKECLHKNKVYSPTGITLTCYPPIHINKWICKDCGFEGEDRNRDFSVFEYDNIKAKFNKGGGNITIK